MNPLSGRRQFGAGALASAFVASVPRAARADLKALEDAARAEGALTWYTGQTDAETAELLGRTFTARYPGIKVAVIRTTGQVAYQRLLLDIKNKTPQCDVFSTTDISHMPALKERKELSEYAPANAARLMPQFSALSDPGFSYVTNAARYFLIYNSKHVKPEDAPKKWTDLLDPRWKGLVATGHPAFSGCTGVWCVAMRKLYGWEYFEKLAKNNPRIGRSGNDPVTLINAGECLVGPAPGNTAFQQVDKGNPIVPVYPSDGSTLCLGPTSVMAGAPHPNAARLYMEWLMSDAFGKLSVANHGDPVHPGLVLTSGQKPLDQVPVLSLTVEEVAKGVPEIVEQWRETFGG